MNLPLQVHTVHVWIHNIGSYFRLDYQPLFGKGPALLPRRNIDRTRESGGNWAYNYLRKGTILGRQDLDINRKVHQLVTYISCLIISLTKTNMPLYNMSAVPSLKNGISEENNTKCQTRIYMYLLAVTCLEIQIFYLYFKVPLKRNFRTLFFYPNL